MLSCVVDTDGTVRLVRIAKSLDAVHGLDKEAVKAIKQWRFAPGTLNGVPVRVLVSVELTFDIGVTPTFPEAFVASGVSPPADSQTLAAVLETPKLSVHLKCPADWTWKRIDRPDLSQLIIWDETGTRSISVNSLTLPSPVAPLHPEARSKLAQTEAEFKERFSTGFLPGIPSSHFAFRAYGQASFARRIWLWNDFVASDIQSFVGALNLLAGATVRVDSMHGWLFTTWQGTQMLLFDCRLMYRATEPGDRLGADVEAAGGQFRKILDSAIVEEK